jgi:competence protein ComEC
MQEGVGSMAGAIGDAKGINLNEASPDELKRIGGVGEERAQRLVEHRPYKSWEDVKKVEGFNETLVNDLKEAGAQI